MDYSTKLSAARYECIVCYLKSSTIDELHRHQTYNHTTEELSLCIIGLRSSLNNGLIKNDYTTYARSWLCDPQKRFEFYALSARLLNDPNNNANFARCIPLDCALDKQVFPDQQFSSETKVTPPETPKEENMEKCKQQQNANQKRTRYKQAKDAKLRRDLNSGVLDLSFGKTSDVRMQPEQSMEISEDVLENVKDSVRAVKIKKKAPKRKKKPAKKKATRKQAISESQTIIGEIVEISSIIKDNREVETSRAEVISDSENNREEETSRAAKKNDKKTRSQRELPPKMYMEVPSDSENKQKEETLRAVKKNDKNARSLRESAPKMYMEVPSDSEDNREEETSRAAKKSDKKMRIQLDLPPKIYTKFPLDSENKQEEETSRAAKRSDKKKRSQRELPQKIYMEIASDGENIQEVADKAKSVPDFDKSFKRKSAARRKLETCKSLRFTPKRANMRKIDSNGEDKFDETHRRNPKTYGRKKTKTDEQGVSPREITTGSAKSVRKIVWSSENQEEMSRNENFDTNCVDRNCHDIADDCMVYTENSVIPKLVIHPHSQIPDVAQEVSIEDTYYECSPVNSEIFESKIENFEKVEYFPPYPPNIDERSILVLDPKACELVWTSFDVINDSTSGNNDEPRRDYDSMIVDDCDMAENTISSNNLSIKSPKEEDDNGSIRSVYHQDDQWEINELTFENEDNLSNTYMQLSTDRTYLQSILTPITILSPLFVNLDEEEMTQNQDLSYHYQMVNDVTTLENEENLGNTNVPMRYSERTISSSPVTVKSEQEENISNQCQFETNEMALKNEKKLSKKHLPHRSKRMKFTHPSPLSVKSDQQADTSKQKMPQRNQSEENLRVANFPLRSRRNRTTTNRYSSC